MSRYFRLMNHLHINKRFHRITPLTIRTNEYELCSPVEAKIEAIVPYTIHLHCKIKNKPLLLEEQLGTYAQQFIWWTVCSCYLAPSNKHFRILPTTGTVIHHKRLHGQAKRFQTILWAEKVLARIPILRYRNLLQAALRRNCTDTTIIQTKHGVIALIAIWSLGVNHIHNYLERGKTYPQWTIAGYFALWSSMLIVCSKSYTITHEEGRIALGSTLWKVIVTDW